MSEMVVLQKAFSAFLMNNVLIIERDRGVG
jgi:hypothetical protein